MISAWLLGGHTLRTHVFGGKRSLTWLWRDCTDQSLKCSPRHLVQYQEVLVCSAIIKVMDRATCRVGSLAASMRNAHLLARRAVRSVKKSCEPGAGLDVSDPKAWTHFAKSWMPTWENGQCFVFSNITAHGVDSGYGKRQQNSIPFRLAC